MRCRLPLWSQFWKVRCTAIGVISCRRAWRVCLDVDVDADVDVLCVCVHMLQPPACSIKGTRHAAQSAFVANFCGSFCRTQSKY